MTDKEALKMALEFIERVNKEGWILDDFEPQMYQAITALKARLAQPEQEPVAWRTFDGEGLYFYCSYEDNETYADVWNKRNPNHKGWVEPLYTTPPQRTWVWLTDEDIGDAYVAWDDADGASFADFARAIEAKLKQKNGYAEEKNT